MSKSYRRKQASPASIIGAGIAAGALLLSIYLAFLALVIFVIIKTVEFAL